MTILLTNDLNGNRQWYDWLLHMADRVDAVCVAGDLVSPLRGNLMEQRRTVEFVAWRLGGSSVGFYVCAGDQDMWGPPWKWLDSQAGTRRLGNLTVTSIPWKSQDPTWFENPHRWNRDRSGPWIVLEHEPPSGSRVATGPAGQLLEKSIGLEFHPGYLVCGHMHDAPWRKGGAWWDRLDRTILFNAGCDPRGSFPSHILLDTARREATWRHSSGSECIRFDAYGPHPPSSKPQTQKKNMNTIQITQSDYNRLQDLLRDATSGNAEDKRCREALFRELMRAKIKPPDELPADVITLRSRARLLDLETGDALEYTLVLPEDADVDAGRISILAPLGTAMLGFRRGDEFEWMMPGGRVKLRVEEVSQPQPAGSSC